MSTVALAWKDPVFRATLDDTDLAALPAHPAGTVGAVGEDALGDPGPTLNPLCLTWVGCVAS